MTEELRRLSRRDSVARQYRDWLIPASLFVGVAAGVLLFAIQAPIIRSPHNMDPIIFAAILAFLSIVFFVLSLLWTFVRLEAMEVLGQTPHRPGITFGLTLGGVLTLLGSLCVLCFVKALALGLWAMTFIAAGVATFLLLARYEGQNEG